MDETQLIKEEIERLKDCQSPIVICDTLLQFIDSLPEESVSKDLENQYTSNMRYQHAYTQDDLMKTKSEDLEEEIDRYYSDWQFDDDTIYEDMRDICRHFAEWQKQKSMQDFLEYLKYCSTFTDTNGITRIDNDLLSAFIEDFKNYMKNE